MQVAKPGGRWYGSGAALYMPISATQLHCIASSIAILTAAAHRHQLRASAQTSRPASLVIHFHILYLRGEVAINGPTARRGTLRARQQTYPFFLARCQQES